MAQSNEKDEIDISQRQSKIRENRQGRALLIDALIEGDMAAFEEMRGYLMSLDDSKLPVIIHQ